jgi:low affinity Fe/Cu permease
MKKTYRHIERSFEKLASFAISILGNSITYLIALSLVIFWLSNMKFYNQDIHDSIGDLILGITFLSLFIIQKSFNRFSASLHLKINELVSSHEPARNSVIYVDEKTESEIKELSKEYNELEERIKVVEDEQS